MTEVVTTDMTTFSDRALLRRFGQSRDEEAFRELVNRHAALVLATCRRGVASHADADDAFQATFLVLARSAGKIRNRDALAAWLYGVATRVCLRMRRDAARRSHQELMDTVAEHADPLDELLARHDEMVADEELNALPTSLRTPLVLRYLAGKSNADVAKELGITIATLEGRLKRGKQRLRMRLLRRGVTLAAMVTVLKSTRVAAEAVPSGLTQATVEAAVSCANATVSSLASEPTTSTHFALQELHAMHATLLSKPIVAALGLSGVAAAVLTAQVAFSQGDSGDAGNPFVLNVTATEQSVEDDPFATKLVSNNSDDDPFGSFTSDEASAASEANNPFEAPQVDPQPTPSTARTVDLGTPPAIVDLKPRSKSEHAVENALVKPLNNLGLEFHNAPLSEVVAFLRSEYAIEIQIDVAALDDIGVAPDEPIDVNLRNIRLESALNIMLRPLDLTYIVDNEVLLITSEDEALTRMETRVYPLMQDENVTYDDVVDMLVNTIAPETWVENGGGSGDIRFLGEKAIIRQTYDVHREINKLLAQLRHEPTNVTAEARTLRNAEIGKADTAPHQESPFSF